MDGPEMTPQPEPDQASELTFGQRLTGIYFEPRKTFESINRKPTWLGLFVILALLGSGVAYALTARMDYQTYMRKAIKMNPMTRNLSEDRVDEIIASRPPSAFQRYSGVFMAPVGMIVGYVVLALVFLVLFILMGASIGFKKSLAVTVWGMGPPGIIVTILSIIFILTKDPQTLDINPAGNVASNLGLLVSPAERPGLNSLLSSIDLFSFWTIYLLATGYSVVSERRITVGKAAAGIIVLWLLYVFGKAWFMS